MSDGVWKPGRGLGQGTDSSPQQARDRRRWPRTPRQAPLHAPARPVLDPLRFSTRALEPALQFDAWKAYVASLVDIRLPEGTSVDDGFPADHTAWHLGGMLFVQQRTPAHSYIRSSASLRASPIDHWYLSIPRSGHSWTEVSGEVAEGAPGQVEFRSLGQPFSGRTLDCETVLIFMPRDLFADKPAVLDGANNSILSGNLAALLTDYVGSVEATLDSLSAQDLPRVVQTVRDMVVACLSAVAGQQPASENQANPGLMERARRHIHRNLHSPDLTPDALSRALGISRTRLYQLFEPSGGVLHYIRRRRLIAAHAALSDPENDQRILDIAQSVGFESAANFSRAFSHEFGYSPREARNAVATAAATQAEPASEQKATRSFDEWLRTLAP